MDAPAGKQNRLPEFDYRTPSAYFVTVCTRNPRNFFWKNVGAAIGRPQDVPLTQWGLVVDKCIRNIPSCYRAVCVDHFVIMPNHIHLLLRICSEDSGRPMAAPTISTVINQLKGAASKKAGFSLWQKGFHDHVIRGEADYREIWGYIENNPARWTEDGLYAES